MNGHVTWSQCSLVFLEVLRGWSLVEALLVLERVWSFGLRSYPFMPLNMTTPHMLCAVMGPYGWTVVASSSSQNSVVAKTIRKKSGPRSKMLKDKVPEAVPDDTLGE